MSEMFGAKRRDWESGPYLEQKRRVTQLYGEIAALGLESHIAELSMYGYTVVPPEKLAPPEYIARLRDAVLAISYRRSGVTPDVVNGSTHVGEKHPLGQFMRYVFFDDPVFEPMLTNPVLLGLVTYLVGDDAILSVHDAMVKGPAEIALPIHNDNGAKHTSVFPDQPNAATLNLLLTDYEEGSDRSRFCPAVTCFAASRRRQRCVASSRRWCLCMRRRAHLSCGRRIRGTWRYRAAIRDCESLCCITFAAAICRRSRTSAIPLRTRRSEEHTSELQSLRH